MLTAIAVSSVAVIVISAALRAEHTSAEELDKLDAKRRELAACSPSLYQKEMIARLEARARAVAFAHFAHGLEWVAMELFGVVLALLSGIAALCVAIGKATEKPLRATRRGVWHFLRRSGQVYIVGARPTLIWAAVPCCIYVFIIGPYTKRPADALQFVAFCGLLGVAVYQRSQDKKNGVASGDNPPGIGMGPGAAAGYA